MPNSNRLFILNSNLPSAAPRITEVDVSRLQIAGYDIDNGYPERIESMRDASPTAKMAIAKRAAFIFGQGLDKDEEAWNFVCNSKGQTLDEVFALCCNDYANWDNFGLHFNYNALFEGVEVTHVPYRKRRNGIGEQAGKYALYDKWWINGANQRFVGGIKTVNIDYIDRFNPLPDNIKANVRVAQGWSNYKGQLFVFNHDYTMHSLDAALDAIDAEILAFKVAKSNIKNNFADKVVLNMPELGIDEIRSQYPDRSDQELYALRDSITELEQTRFNNWVGAEDQAQLIVNYYRNEAEKLSFDKIENRLDDKKFAFTMSWARQSMYTLLGQNAVLHSDLDRGNYNQGQLPEAIKAYNNWTEQDRIKMQRAFKRSVGAVFPALKDCNFSITPLNDLTSATQNNEGASNGNTNIPNN